MESLKENIKRSAERFCKNNLKKSLKDKKDFVKKARVFAEKMEEILLGFCGKLKEAGIEKVRIKANFEESESPKIGKFSKNRYS